MDERAVYKTRLRGMTGMELDGLNTSDEVIDALKEIAEKDEAEFMGLWEYGYTQSHTVEQVEEMVKEHIRTHVPEEKLEDFYSWGIEKVWMEKIEIKHRIIKMKSVDKEVHIVADDVSEFTPYIKALMSWSNDRDYDAVEDWHTEEYYLVHAVEGHFKVHKLDKRDMRGLFYGGYVGSPEPLVDYDDREIIAYVYMKISREEYEKLSEYIDD